MEIRTAADIALVVRTARTRRQLSQLQLARSAGVSRRWLINLEAGKPGASMDLVMNVLATLGVPLHAGSHDSEDTSGGHGLVAPAPVGTIDLDEHLRKFDGPRR